jgi:hypothetical protein
LSGPNGSRIDDRAKLSIRAGFRGLILSGGPPACVKKLIFAAQA